MRMDGQSRPAPHHYVEALFKQIKYPNLEGYIKFDELTLDDGTYYLNISFIVFNYFPTTE